MFQTLLKEKDKSKNNEVDELDDTVDENEQICDHEFVYESLCSIFNEPLYLIKITKKALGDKDLIAIAEGKETPILWLKCYNSFAIIIEQKIVLRYESFKSSFLAYASSFSVFNISWLSIIKVKFGSYVK